MLLLNFTKLTIEVLMPLLSTLKDELAKAQTIAAAALAATEAKEKAAIAAAKKDLAKNPNKKLRDTARNTANAANDAQTKAAETAAAAKHMAEKVSAAQQERASNVTVTTVAAAIAKYDELYATHARLSSYINQTYTKKSKKTPANLKDKIKTAKQTLAIAKEEVEFQSDIFLTSVEAKKKAVNAKIAAEHAEFLAKLSNIAKGLNQGKSAIAKQEAKERQAISDAFNNSAVKVAHDLRKSDQTAKASAQAAQTAVTQIKQPSAISKVVTRVLNSIKIVANLITKVIIAPFVLTGRAIAAVGQVVAKVAKAINPIAAYKNHKAKKAAVAQEVKDFDAAFGQGLNLAMQVLADEHKNASAVKRTVRFSSTESSNDEVDYSDMPPLAPADDNDSLKFCFKK